jgi:HD-GYP domain-containing protein (c-di-GMP phosphodiesterase class II)
MGKRPIRVLYILHENEYEPPCVLSEAAEIVLARTGGTPHLSALDEPPHLIVMGTPLDEEMLRELHTVEALHLPIIGLGTGPAEHLAVHVSGSISAEDLRVVLDLTREQAGIWSLDASSDEHPLVAKLLESFTDHVTRMIEHLLALRIPEYRKRTDRALETCEWIASHLGMSDQELRPLLYATCFREIGKMGLPDRILFSTQSSRTPAEQQLYSRYPEMGAKVIAELPNLLDSAQTLKYLLENYDGSGPEGLQSSQIPLASRILRVVSAYEMIAEDLPEGASTEEIMTVLKNGQGSLYDSLLLRLVQNYHTLTGGENGNQRRSRLIRLADVVEGMILAEDVWSRTGVKIMPRGTRITERILNLLQSGSVDATLESVEIQTHEEA